MDMGELTDLAVQVVAYRAELIKQGVPFPEISSMVQGLQQSIILSAATAEMMREQQKDGDEPWKDHSAEVQELIRASKEVISLWDANRIIPHPDAALDSMESSVIMPLRSAIKALDY
jgi:hypothetical protein